MFIFIGAFYFLFLLALVIIQNRKIAHLRAQIAALESHP